MNRWCICALACMALWLTACQPHPLDDPWPRARPLGADLQTPRPPRSPEQARRSAAPAPPAVQGQLTLRQAMALTLTHSPKLQAFGWDVRQAEAEALQAGLWPNPEFGVELENFAGSDAFAGTDSIESTIGLAQQFPVGGDIQRRRELAAYEAKLAGWDYEAARVEVLTELTKRYVNMLAAQRRAALAEESLALSEQVQQLTRKRIDAGDAPPIELARASVSVATARVEARRQQRQIEAARTQLALMWGQRRPGFGDVAGSLDGVTPPPEPQRLVDLINQNPEVARWATEISARRAGARLAAAEAVPDVTASLGYRYDRAEAAGALVAGVSLPLPIFDRRQGDILAARLGATAAEQRKRAVELRIEAALSESYTRLIAAYEEAVALRDEALPPANEAFTLTRRAFENGDLGLLDVLDSERTLVDLRGRYLSALAEYHTAAAEVESLIGQPLSALQSGGAPPEIDITETKIP